MPQTLDADLSDFIARIYDTVLEPDNWSPLLLELAHRLGAGGAMVFEVAKGGASPSLLAPYYSQNYQPDIVKAYLDAHKDIELADQEKFARYAGSEDAIELINDTAFLRDDTLLSQRPNVVELMRNGLKHRAGTLLNKDSWTIDRMAIQYPMTRGPASDAERDLGRIILPHVSKALRIGRPLIQAKKGTPTLEERLDRLSFGVCILSAKEQPILCNAEFDRIVDAHGVFRLSREGKLLLRGDTHAAKYRSLISGAGVHGKTGAYPRRQSICFALGDAGAGLFIEVCPIEDNVTLGRFAPDTRLITVLDATKIHGVDPALVSRFFPLSKTEQMVLHMIGQGLSTTEIAENRNRSPETVKSQTKAILHKTYTKNRVELVQLSLSLNSPFSTTWMN